MQQKPNIFYFVCNKNCAHSLTMATTVLIVYYFEPRMIKGLLRVVSHSHVRDEELLNEVFCCLCHFLPHRLVEVVKHLADQEVDIHIVPSLIVERDTGWQANRNGKKYSRTHVLIKKNSSLMRIMFHKVYKICIKQKYNKYCRTKRNPAKIDNFTIARLPAHLTMRRQRHRSSRGPPSSCKCARGRRAARARGTTGSRRRCSSETSLESV